VQGETTKGREIMKEIIVALFIITGLIAVPYLTGDQLVSVHDGAGLSINNNVNALASNPDSNI
jgi:hypothetical protein